MNSTQKDNKKKNPSQKDSSGKNTRGKEQTCQTPDQAPQAGQRPPEGRKRKMSPRQIAALAGVVVLVLLYLIMLAAAILDSTATAQWFRICLGATAGLPLLIWIYSWMYSRLTGKSAIGDPASPEVSSTPLFGDETNTDAPYAHSNGNQAGTPSKNSPPK